MNRAVSRRSYSGLFLMPARLSVGDLLPVSLKTPPSSTGTYANFAPVRCSICGITRWAKYALGLPKSKWNSTLAMASPFFCKGSDLPLERPGVAGLLIELPIGLGNGGRPHQPARIEIGERRLALAFLDPPANPGSVDPGIDHQMRNVDVLRAELARRALRHGAQSEFGAGKSGVTGATAQARSGSSKEDVAAVPRNHQTRRLPPGEETGVTRHFPNFAEYPLGGLDQRKVDVRPDVEDAYLQRSPCIGVLQEGRHLVLSACVERAADNVPTGRLNLSDQRRQPVAVAAAGEDSEPLGREFLGDRGADKVSGADYCCGSVFWFQCNPLNAGRSVIGMTDI